MQTITSIFGVAKATIEEKTLTTEEAGTFHYVILTLIDKNGNENQVKLFAPGSDHVTIEFPQASNP